MSDTVTCPGCQKAFSDRRLIFKAVTTENCPFCDHLINRSGGFSYRNDDVKRVDDVAAIDAWAEQLRKQFKINVNDSSVSECGAERKWSVDSQSPWQCEIIYPTLSTGFISVRLFCDEKADKLLEDPKNLQVICAKYGTQPWGIKGERILWGTEQYLSTGTLCPEIFEPTVERLKCSMQAALARLGE